MSIFNWFSKNKPKEETPAAQEEQAAQIQGQHEHRVHVHFENEQQQHAASVTHFSSGQRFSPKASSNYEMSEKVRASVLDSTIAKRKE